MVNQVPNSLDSATDILNNQYESLFKFLENYKLNWLKDNDTNWL